MKPRILTACFALAACAVATALWAPSSRAKDPALPHIWPPVVGQEYPDLELKNSEGVLVKLSSFKGKVIVVEPIGMGCPACQAFAGAHEKGTFAGGSAQARLPSYEKLLEDHKVKSSDKRLVYVQLLLYDMSNRKAPTVEDAKNWAAHFGIDKQKNAHVLVGDARYINRASYNLIPGFQLIDKSFVLQKDSSGHHPKHNLYTELLPQIKPLLKAKAKKKKG